MCHTSQCIEGFFEHHIFLIDILKIENLRSNRDQPAESTYKTWTCLIFQDETVIYSDIHTTIVFCSFHTLVSIVLIPHTKLIMFEITFS